MRYFALCFLVLRWGLVNCSGLSSIESRVLDVDPDANRNVTQLIRSRGYPVEEYTVQTRDGYLLKLFRIPYGRHRDAGTENRTTRNRTTGNGNTRNRNTRNRNTRNRNTRNRTTGKKNTRNRNAENRNARNRPVVFLQHGFLGSASDWVINFRNQSLGYILADQGYDVWMGNQRGNAYARKHVKYSPEDSRFWDFGMDEHAEYDTPDSIDFVLSKTRRSQLYYVGWSQGCMIVFAFLSQTPDYNKIKAIFSLAPTATVGYIQSPVRYLAPFSGGARDLFSLTGHKEFLPNNFVTELFARTVCNVDYLKLICSNLYFQINGYDFYQLNRSRLSVYISHFPAGTSTKTVLHYLQMINSKKFQKFDYGILNLKKYKRISPPKYQIENIQTKIALFTSLNDKLSNPKDVDILRSGIKNLIADYRVSLKEWGHLDFVFAIETKKYVYDYLLRLMKSV